MFPRVYSFSYLFIHYYYYFLSKVYSFSRSYQASLTIWTNGLAAAWAWTGVLSDTFPALSLVGRLTVTEYGGSS